MFCPICGTKNPQEFSFCMSCGSTLPRDEPAAPPTMATATVLQPEEPDDAPLATVEAETSGVKEAAAPEGGTGHKTRSLNKRPRWLLVSAAALILLAGTTVAAFAIGSRVGHSQSTAPNEAQLATGTTGATSPPSSTLAATSTETSPDSTTTTRSSAASGVASSIAGSVVASSTTSNVVATVSTTVSTTTAKPSTTSTRSSTVTTSIPVTTTGNGTTHGYAIGSRGPAGGLIFYDKGDNRGGWQYLEAAPAGSEWEEKEWGVAGTAIPGAGNTAIGTGRSNTAAIVASQGAGSTYAAQLCSGLTSGGFSDWFLPSKDELALMYTNLFGHDVGDLRSTFYWSSSESGAKYAWFQFFGDLDPAVTDKDATNLVRAIRAF
jgi:hypothetical protein